MSIHATAKPGRTKKMNKAVVASAIGLSLLIGGGSYALWNSTSTANSGASITTGDLKVTPAAAQKWSDVTVPASPVADLDLTTYRLVPGATIQLKQDVTVIAYGDKMLADLSIKVPNAATGSILAQSVATVAVFNAADTQVGTATAPISGLGDIDVKIEVPRTDAAGEVYRVEVKVALPTTADDTTKLQTIALGDMQLSLVQVASR